MLDRACAKPPGLLPVIRGAAAGLEGCARCGLACVTAAGSGARARGPCGAGGRRGAPPRMHRTAPPRKASPESLANRTRGGHARIDAIDLKRPKGKGT